MAESKFQDIKFTDADVVNPDEYSKDNARYNIKPWLIHDHGFVVAVVFANNLQEALDEAVDADKLAAWQLNSDEQSVRDEYMHAVQACDGYLVKVYGNGQDNAPTAYLDWNDEVALLGNASEPFDIEGLEVVELPNPPFSFCALLNAAPVTTHVEDEDRIIDLHLPF